MKGTPAVGTQALFKATDSLGITARFLALLDKTTVAVRGPKPAGVLRARGVRIDRSAAEQVRNLFAVAKTMGKMDALLSALGGALA